VFFELCECKGEECNVTDVTSGTNPTAPLDAFTRLELLDAVSIGIWVFDGEQPRYFNRALAELLGYSQEELLVPGVFEALMTPESMALLSERGKARVRGDADVPDKYEISLNTRRGDRVHLAITAQRAELSFGPASLVTAVDVTERKLAEEDRQSSDARFTTLLDTVPVAVIVADAKGRPLYMNRAWQEFTGLSVEEALREGIAKSIHPDEFKAVRDAQIAALETAESYVMDSRLRNAKGRYRWHKWRVDPVRSRDGRLLGWIAAATDIHNEREVQQRLRHRNEMLDAASREKDEVLGMISHELRTPLTTLRGNASIVSRKGAELATDDIRSALDDIARDAERLQFIIENMLLLARADNDKGVELEPVLLTRMVPRVVEEFRSSRPHREVELDLCETALPVFANTMYLRQVLLNLLSNAEKYSPREAPITVRMGEREGYATLAVEDRGIGIKEAERERLFEPYFRSEVTAGTTPGIGLGLTVCKRLAEEQHGALSVAARPGGGTCFELTLPLLGEDFPS
jgi:PAS domain S-box-containing protein